MSSAPVLRQWQLVTGEIDYCSGARIADFPAEAVILLQSPGPLPACDVCEDSGMTTAPAPRADQSNVDHVLARTRHWLETVVIGLNLCPFAKAVHRKNQIRYVVSSVDSSADLTIELARELRLLQEAEPEQIDTTLLIHPLVLTDFIDYNAFLGTANRLLRKSGLEGVLQIASFHPQYAFGDAGADAIENYTNRSPYPMLHLLREASVARAVDAFPEADAIYEHNMATLQRLGPAGWRRLAVGAEDDTG